MSLRSWRASSADRTFESTRASKRNPAMPPLLVKRTLMRAAVSGTAMDGLVSRTSDSPVVSVPAARAGRDRLQTRPPSSSKDKSFLMVQPPLTSFARSGLLRMLIACSAHDMYQRDGKGGPPRESRRAMGKCFVFTLTASCFHFYDGGTFRRV